MNRTTTNRRATLLASLLGNKSRESEFPPTKSERVGNRGLTARGACLLLLSCNSLRFVCNNLCMIQNY